MKFRIVQAKNHVCDNISISVTKLRGRMVPVGYAHLIQRLALQVRPIERPAWISGAVNKRIDSETQVLFPRGVAIEDSVTGHRISTTVLGAG